MNLANLYENIDDRGRPARETAAELRQDFYQSLARTSGRLTPSTCSICLEDDPTPELQPEAATEGVDGKLVILPCSHCFHTRWEPHSCCHLRTAVLFDPDAT